MTSPINNPSTPGTTRRSRPIVWHLVVLAIGAAAPFAVLTAYLSFQLLGDEADEASMRVERYARATVADADQTVRRARLILEELARRPAVFALDPRRCDPLLGDLLRLNPEFANVFTLDATGSRVCSAAPVPAGASPRVDPRYYLDALRQRKAFTVGSPAKGFIAGRWVISAAQPILGSDGAIAGVVGVSVDLVAFSRVINKDSLMPDAIVAILDADGTIVTRYPDAQGWAGRDAAASPIARIALQRKSGTAREKGLLGIERLWAFAPAGEARWVVLSGIPTEVVLAPVQRATTWIAGLAVAGIAFVIALSMAIARPIAGPIEVIAAAARRMSSGDSVERMAPSGPTEIAGLAQDLNRMLERRVAADHDLRRSEVQVNEGRLRLEGIVASAMDAIVTVDAAQRITLFNPAAERMFRMRADDVIGRTLEMLIPATQRARHAGHIAHFGQTGVTSRTMASLGTVYGVRADGEQFPLEAAISQVEVGGQKSYTAILRDITGRLRDQQQVRELTEDLEHRVAERTSELEAANRELHAFDYSISHDLRGPLNRIRGFGDVLLEGYTDRLPPEGADLVRRIQAAGESMNRMVSDMLALSTISRGEVHRADVDLSAMARNILESFQRTEPARRVEAVVAPGVRAEADPGLMHIVLENLLANAWKFTSRQVCARIEFGCATDGGTPRYYVRDDGAGFDPALAGKLFEPFRRLHSQAEFQGTGVGLATVQRVVHRHGGIMSAEGAVGQGATFYFTLSH